MSPPTQLPQGGQLPDEVMLSGWGRTAPSAAHLVQVDEAHAAEVIRAAGHRGVIARGLGRSYGDPAQNAGGVALRLTGHMDEAVVDPASGTVRVGAGVSIDDLLRVLVPQGFFVPVTAGTRLITVGGAIASDIHGKNHHVEGSFGNHVRSLTMLLADGSVVEVGPERDPDLFWATLGGMGLTGLILEATFGLIRIETSRCITTTMRVNDLDELMSAMVAGDEHHRYVVAWVDVMAKGAQLGRSVLTLGDHATIDQLEAKARQDPLAYDPRQRISVPPLVPARGVINRWTISAFNEMWFRKAPRRSSGQIESIPAYFHPLDAVGSWNRLYGRQGFVQYQFVVPFGQEDALRRAIEMVSASGSGSFLAVLKRFGDANPAPLSFPRPGWTFAIDVPAGHRSLPTMLHRLDRIVLDAGGRHYCAKDAHTTPQAFRRGYPRFEEWRAIRDRVDPEGVWRSDLARRLDLVS